MEMDKSKPWTKSNVRPADTALVVLTFEDDEHLAGEPPEELVSTPLDEMYRRLDRYDSFSGKTDETHSVEPVEGELRQLVFSGLGGREKLTAERVRRSVGRAIQQISLDQIAHTVIPLPESPDVPLSPYEIGRAYQEGVLLSSYDFARYRSDNRSDRAEHVYVPGASAVEVDRGIDEGYLYAKGTSFARDLANEPPSRMDPDDLVDTARSLEGKHVSVRVLREDELRSKGMEPTLGVSAGSNVEPAQILLKYRPENSVDGDPHIGLAGKGVTFDSGGLNLKSHKGMMDMKFDMCGAAAVLGVFKVLQELGTALPVTGVCGCTENMTGSDAQKMRDVVTNFGGTSIEITHTDAEGRLVLSDAIPYLEEQGVSEIIDLATLTGSVITALGSGYAGLMTDDQELRDRLNAASERAGEEVWELPLEDEYESYLDSSVADVRNTGKKNEAGAIVAGLFLRKFVDDCPWAHLDIAGTAWRDEESDYRPEGGVGFGVRTLLDYVQHRAGEH